MYPVIEDVHGSSEYRDGNEYHWRQVQLRVGEPFPYDHSGVTWRVVAWGMPDCEVKVWGMWKKGDEWLPSTKLRPLGIDLDPHHAFCRGDLPAYLYADWLEENGVDVNPVGLSLLRGWILNEVKG